MPIVDEIERFPAYHLFAGTAGWLRELLGRVRCDPGTKEHAQPSRICIPPRHLTSHSSRRRLAKWCDAGRRLRIHVRIASRESPVRAAG